MSVAWTAPKAYGLEASTSAHMNTYLSANSLHLQERPCCIVFNSADQSSAVGWRTLTFNSEEVDTASMHSTVSDTGRILLVEAGIYLCWANVYLLNVGAALIGISILHSEDSAEPGGHALTAIHPYSSVISPSRIVYTEATDTYVTVRLYQSAGATTNIVAAIADRLPYFGAVKLRDVI